MAWGGPVEPAPRRDSWKKEIRRGPRPGDHSPYEAMMQDRYVASAFGTQVAFVGALVLIVVAALVFYAQYSGAVRWLLAVVLLATAAFVMARYVASRVRDPRPLHAGALVERRAPGDLRSLATTFDRASAGLKYSQIMFDVRMKDAFLERVRIARNLSPEDVDRLRADPEALMRVVGDRELALFVLEGERNGRHWPALLRVLPARRGYAAETERVLAKMEAWR